MCSEGPDGNDCHHVRGERTDATEKHGDATEERTDVTTGTTRRTVLGAVGLATGASVAGCLGDLTGGGDGETPAPVSLAGGLDCDNCGMIIEKHPGPNGQLFFEDESPEGHDNPARFDALKQCFFPYRLEREQTGWTVAAAYVTDYSSVDYDVSTQGDATTISSHADPESFADAEGLRYVVDSEVEGAMGPDFVPFSEEGDAEAFAEEYGGEVLAYGDIDETLVGK